MNVIILRWQGRPIQLSLWKGLYEFPQLGIGIEADVTGIEADVTGIGIHQLSPVPTGAFRY